MYLNKLAEFAGFLCLKQHSMDELFSYLIYRVLDPVGVSSVFLSQLDQQNKVSMIYSYGVDPAIWQAHPPDQAISVFDKYPLTDALRTRKTIWINTLPDWGEEYPLLKGIEFPGKEKTFICMSIERSNTPIAVCGFFAHPVIEVDAELDSFFSAISNLISLELYRFDASLREDNSSNQKGYPNNREQVDDSLTERQLVILQLIADGRTNISISEMLGYSESTIRQETIKIYNKLKCKGRAEASRIYRERFKSPQTIEASESTPPPRTTIKVCTLRFLLFYLIPSKKVSLMTYLG
jgi:DNA-binding CsgD family transcriptional regulator